MEIAEHLDALRRQGELMAAAAERAGLAATVPSCPSWQVKDLLRHTGYIHRWATRHLTERPGQVLDGPSEAEILRGGAADEDLLDWFRAGHAALVRTLATADPAVVYATFMPAPSPLAFWTRRQAHETAIHRADAELASGPAPEYPPDFGCTVSGPASGLYLYLWNRADAAEASVTVAGDLAPLAPWQASVRIRWG